MPGSPQTPRELDAFRERADRFIAALDEEYYLHYAGHKDSLELRQHRVALVDLLELQPVRQARVVEVVLLVQLGDEPVGLLAVGVEVTL